MVILLSNANRRRNGHAGWAKYETPEDAEAVGQAFSKAAEKYKMSPGIDLVLVPVQTRNRKRRLDATGFDMENEMPITG